VGVEPGADCRFWESVLLREGEAIAHLQENISALPVSLRSSSAAPRRWKSTTTTAAPACQHAPTLRPDPRARRMPDQPEPGGPSRAKLLDLRAPDPVLVLTQYVRHANRPLYLAKCLIAPVRGISPLCSPKPATNSGDRRHQPGSRHRHERPQHLHQLRREVAVGLQHHPAAGAGLLR
jgi:hypothetical protein